MKKELSNKYNYGNINLITIQEDEKEQSSIKKESRGDIELSGGGHRRTLRNEDTELRLHKESMSQDQSVESPDTKQAHLYAAGKQANQWKLHF